MSITNGRLFRDMHRTGYKDIYCYDSVDLAVLGMMEFDPSMQREPVDGIDTRPVGEVGLPVMRLRNTSISDERNRNFHPKN